VNDAFTRATATKLATSVAILARTDAFVANFAAFVATNATIVARNVALLATKATFFATIAAFVATIAAFTTHFAAFLEPRSRKYETIAEEGETNDELATTNDEVQEANDDRIDASSTFHEKREAIMATTRSFLVAREEGPGVESTEATALCGEAANTLRLARPRHIPLQHLDLPLQRRPHLLRPPATFSPRLLIACPARTISSNAPI
jgi:hypothetical protein